MQADSHRDYLARRERECRKAAEKAKDPGVARVHLDFARTYRAALARTIRVTLETSPG